MSEDTTNDSIQGTRSSSLHSRCLCTDHRHWSIQKSISRGASRVYALNSDYPRE